MESYQETINRILSDCDQWLLTLDAHQEINEMVPIRVAARLPHIKQPVEKVL